MARKFDQEEITAIAQAELLLKQKGLIVSDEDGKEDVEHNAEVVKAFFEMNGHARVTVQSILAAVQQMKDQLKWRSAVEIEYSKLYLALSESNKAQFGSWWASQKNTLVLEGQPGFANASKILRWMQGKTFNGKSLNLAVSNLAASVGLDWAPTREQPSSGRPHHEDDGTGFLSDKKEEQHYRGGKKNHSFDPKPEKEVAKSEPAEANSWREMAEALHSNIHSIDAELAAVKGNSWRETYRLRKAILNR